MINLALGLLLPWILKGSILRLTEDVGGCKMKDWAESFVFLHTEKKSKLTEQFV